MILYLEHHIKELIISISIFFTISQNIRVWSKFLMSWEACGWTGEQQVHKDQMRMHWSITMFLAGMTAYSNIELHLSFPLEPHRLLSQTVYGWWYNLCTSGQWADDNFQIAIWMVSVAMFCILNMTLSQLLAFYKNFWIFNAEKLLKIELSHHDIYWPAW